MNRPILKIDDDRRIVLAEQRLGPAILTVMLIVVLLGIRGLAPSTVAAQALFAMAALWAAAGLLRVHELRIEIAQRHWTYRRGWIFRPPQREGDFSDLDHVSIEANTAVDGLVTSRLRSRLIFLHFRDWPEGIIALGFPMGPNVAVDRAESYGRRLGLPVVDRTDSGDADGATDSQGEPGTGDSAA
ncbi:MAG: hypothetical protein AAGN46_16320 [Acidobacteriota bacterium]